MSAKVCPLSWRIIPARAGFTPACTADQSLVTDHPRSRGVYVAVGWHAAERRGSSPLARGLLLLYLLVTASFGIIPARAGFTRRVLAHKGA